MPKASTFSLRLATQMIDSDTFPMLTNAGENVRLPVSEARNLVGPGWSATVNAYNEAGLTREIKIQAAITRAVSTGATRVFVPTSMLPYDATAITFNTAIQMVREGGSFDVYDVQAYGASGDNSTNDSAAIQAAVLGAQGASGGRVFFPRPAGRYYTGTTTVAITAHGVILEAADIETYIRYGGTGYALTFALAGAAQIVNCGMAFLGVLCDDPDGSAVYLKSPYSFFIDHGYFENGHGSTINTAAGITIDGGLTSGGTGYYGTHNVLSQVRVSGFLKGILFKGGSLAGWDITTGSTLHECFVSSMVGLTGSVGVEFQGSQQCIVRGGYYEVLDYGVKCVSTPSRCNSITLEAVHFEAIAVANWSLPSDTTNTVILAPSITVDNGVDSAVDTHILMAGRFRYNGAEWGPLTGTWTPTMIGDSVAGTQTYAVQAGQYVKIGRLVTVTCYVSISAKGGTMAGNVQVGGLPFASTGIANALSGCALTEYLGVTIPGGRTEMGVETGVSATTLYLIANGSGLGPALLPVASIAASTYFIFCLQYMAAS